MPYGFRKKVPTLWHDNRVPPKILMKPETSFHDQSSAISLSTAEDRSVTPTSIINPPNFMPERSLEVILIGKWNIQTSRHNQSKGYLTDGK